MKNALLIVDTRSDRRDLWELLHLLPPARRLTFLRWCCVSASRPGANCPTPVPEMRQYVIDATGEDANARHANLRLTNMVYLDLAAIGQQYDFDLGQALVVLEEWVRKGGELPPIAMGDYLVKV